MKEETEKLLNIAVPESVVDMLHEVRKGDIMRPSIRQLATAALLEKYGNRSKAAGGDNV